MDDPVYLLTKIIFSSGSIEFIKEGGGKKIIVEQKCKEHILIRGIY